MSLDTKVSALTASLRSEFWKAWNQVAEPAPWESFTSQVDSTTKIENWFNQTPCPGYQKWSGMRNYAQTKAFIYSVLNQTFHTEIGASLEDVEDDQVGVLQQQPKVMSQKGKLFPGRMVLKLLGQAMGGAIANQTAAVGSFNAFDNLPYFSNRLASSGGFGSGNNVVNFTSASGDGKVFLLAGLFTGDKVLKPLAWQRRSGPDFRTNSGENQAFESRMVRWWSDLRGAPFFTYFWNCVGVTITNTPSVAEMHAIYSAVENAFRTFKYPQTTSIEDGEYVHEQTVFGQDNLHLVGSTALGVQMRQSLTQEWVPQTIGGSPVATTNEWKGWAKYSTSRYLDNV